MFFRFTPPNLAGGLTQPGSVWINTDHIARVEEIRRRPGEEPLELRIYMKDQPITVVNEASAGKGAAERMLDWLEGQTKHGDNRRSNTGPVPIK